MRRSIPMLAAACLVVGLAGCAGEDDGPGTASSPDDAFQPTESPSMSVTMIEPPGDYSSIEGEDYTISAPGEFQRQFQESSNGERMLVLEKPSRVPALPQRVAVLRDVEPASSAAEQSYVLETTKAAAGPEGRVSRVRVPAEGEDAHAFLVTWQEARPAGGGQREPVEVTYWQLMYQAGDGPILNVVALAPTEEFETSEVSRILRTFRPTSSA